MNAQLAPLSSTRGYVGGGSIAGILGLSPFKSPLDEYLTITGDEAEITPEKRRFFDRRKAWEPTACHFFEAATGLQIDQINERYSDKEFVWAKAEIDAECLEGGERINIEFKTVHPSAAQHWGNPDEGEEPPIYVTAQAMWGLGITGRNRAYVHGLDLDNDRIYRVERDDDLIAEIRKQAERFWRFYVVPRRPPPPANVEDLLRLYRTDSGRAVEADADIRDSLEALCNERQALALHTSRKEIHEYAIKSYMRDATTLLVHGQPAISWKARADGVRVFRLR